MTQEISKNPSKDQLASLTGRKVRDFQLKDTTPWSESSNRSAVVYIRHLVFAEEIPSYLLKDASTDQVTRLISLHDHQVDAILSAYAEAGFELFTSDGTPQA